MARAAALVLPAAAVPTVEKACKQGHRFGIVRPACFGFQNPLHQFKLLCRNDCFMGVVHDYPVPHRHVHFLFGAIVQSPCLSLHQFSDIDLVVQNAVHRLGRPRRLIALAEMQAQLCTALQLSCSRGQHLFRIQSVCDALIIVQIENGTKVPSLSVLVKIANTLSVSADELLLDCLEYPSSSANSEIHRLLLDCNETEQTVIIRMAKELKAILVSLGV